LACISPAKSRWRIMAIFRLSRTKMKLYLRYVCRGCTKQSFAAYGKLASMGNSRSRPAFFVACSVLSGCAPSWEHYQRVEAPEAVYLRSECGGFGPRNYAYYPYHGIFISVSLSPLQLGLHYPAGTTVALSGDTVTISGSRQNEPIEYAQHLRQASHGTLGNGTPGEFCAMTDPMDPEGRHGYRCPSSGHDLTWSYFVGRDKNSSVPTNLEHAKIIIPAVTINGQTYESQELSIVGKKFVGVVPINC
jgi:hypothetical protein